MTEAGVRRVVVGVDGSAGSRAALHEAVGEARRRDARLDVVTSWHYPVLTTIPSYGVMPPSDEMTAEAAEGLHQFLVDEGIAGADDLEVVELVAEGPAPAALLEAAEGAEVLVVGSRGRGGFTGLLLGSVSQTCVTHAPCPVLVVPAPGADEDEDAT